MKSIFPMAEFVRYWRYSHHSPGIWVFGEEMWRACSYFVLCCIVRLGVLSCSLQNRCIHSWDLMSWYRFCQSLWRSGLQVWLCMIPRFILIHARKVFRVWPSSLATSEWSGKQLYMVILHSKLNIHEHGCLKLSASNWSKNIGALPALVPRKAVVGWEVPCQQIWSWVGGSFALVLSMPV